MQEKLISVIIATYNRCESLKDTLDSLLVQEDISACSFEIVVIDNNSTDDTKKVIESYIPRFDGRLIYLFESKQGKYFALNKGIKESNGEIIALTDDDCILDKKWILNIWNFFQAHQCDGLGGRVLPKFPLHASKWLVKNKDLLDGPFGFYDYGEENRLHRRKEMLPFVGANSVFKRNCFEEDDLFRNDLGPGKGTKGGDTEFCERLEKTGKSLYYSGSVLVYHKVRPETINLSYIAKWNQAGGRYSILKDGCSKKKDFVHYFGIPRYMIRELVQDVFILVFSFVSPRNFLKKWIKVSWMLGVMSAYRGGSR